MGSFGFRVSVYIYCVSAHPETPLASPGLVITSDRNSYHAKNEDCKKRVLGCTLRVTYYNSPYLEVCNFL